MPKFKGEIASNKEYKGKFKLEQKYKRVICNSPRKKKCTFTINQKRMFREVHEGFIVWGSVKDIS